MEDIIKILREDLEVKLLANAIAGSSLDHDIINVLSGVVLENRALRVAAREIVKPAFQAAAIASLEGPVRFDKALLETVALAGLRMFVAGVYAARQMDKEKEQANVNATD